MNIQKCEYTGSINLYYGDPFWECDGEPFKNNCRFSETILSGSTLADIVALEKRHQYGEPEKPA